MDRTFKIFMDFDGTISTIDVGDELFRKFGDKELTNKIISDLLEDKITSRDCWTQLCKNAGSVNKNKWDKLINNVEIEPSFHLFVKYCNEHCFELFILSDGFDYYIEKILDRQKINGIKFFSNNLSITSEGFLIPSFPYFDEDCRSSANCKRRHIIENSSEDDYTVFIGDGNSDKDPIEYVDFIFAKDDLLKHCEKQRITYYPFKDLNDVIKRLNELNSKKRLKKRHQAELKRREAYLME
jgi:2,3-diketo-5-methylthio-1-phosphopentane phosphatase